MGCDPRTVETWPAPAVPVPTERFTNDATAVEYLTDRVGLLDVTVVDLLSLEGVDLEGLVFLADFGWKPRYFTHGRTWWDPSGGRPHDVVDAVRIVRKDVERGDQPSSGSYVPVGKGG